MERTASERRHHIDGGQRNMTLRWESGQVATPVTAGRALLAIAVVLYLTLTGSAIVRNNTSDMAVAVAPRAGRPRRRPAPPASSSSTPSSTVQPAQARTTVSAPRSGAPMAAGGPGAWGRWHRSTRRTRCRTGRATWLLLRAPARAPGRSVARWARAGSPRRGSRCWTGPTAARHPGASAAGTSKRGSRLRSERGSGPRSGPSAPTRPVSVGRRR